VLRHVVGDDAQHQLLQVAVGGEALQALHHAGAQRQRARRLRLLQPGVAQRLGGAHALARAALQHALQQVAG
jgi:hypothetical protein